MTGELAFYRKYTEAVLRRYAQLADGAGRAPTLLGRELFRSEDEAVSPSTGSIDERLDMERLIARLSQDERCVIQRVALEGYEICEAATLLGMSGATCCRRYARTLDRLTALLLQSGLFRPLGVAEA